MLDVIRVTTTGSAGSATGTGISELPFSGFVMGIKVDYDDSAPATTTVVITENGGLGRTILTLGAANTDAIYNPQFQIMDDDGVAQTLYSPFYISSQSLLVTIAGADALTNAVVVSTVILEA